MNLRKAAEELLALKEHKDTHGKDEQYIQRQPAAWEALREALAEPENEPQNPSHDYAYKTVEEYEKIVEHKVNDSFKFGWDKQGRFYES